MGLFGRGGVARQVEMADVLRQAADAVDAGVPMSAAITGTTGTRSVKSQAASYVERSAKVLYGMTVPALEREEGVSDQTFFLRACADALEGNLDQMKCLTADVLSAAAAAWKAGDATISEAVMSADAPSMVRRTAIREIEIALTSLNAEPLAWQEQNRPEYDWAPLVQALEEGLRQRSSDPAG